MLTLTATEYHAQCLAAQALSDTSVASIESLHSWRHFFEMEMRAAFPERLLSAIEEHLLWVQILKLQPDVHAEQIWALAKILAENERVRCLNRIPLAEIDQEGRAENQFFIRAQKQFDKKLRALKAYTFLQGLERLSGRKTYQVILFGFVDLPALYQTLAPLGSPCPLGKPKIDVLQILEASDPITEFKQALRCILNMPDQRFALVVNHTVLDAKTVHLILAEMRLGQQIQYSSSIRERLIDQPWFEFFQAWAGSFLTEDFEQLSCVLSSQYLGGDRAQNAQWDAQWRERAEARTTLLAFLQSLPAEAKAQGWWQQWQKMAHFIRSPKTACEWLELIQACQFNGFEFEETWRRYLLKLSELHQDKIRYSWIEWLQIMWEIAGSFYLPQPYYAKPKLHIVGFLEAVDLPVDAVWLLSADETHLPLPPSLPVFIPKRLLPEEQPALLLTRITAGKQVYASFVKSDEASLSPLLNASGRWQADAPQWIFVDALEWVEDQAQLPLHPDQYHNVKGGSSLLEAQAKCPFKAFATYRLGIKEWSTGRHVLDPLQKGILVHRLLERFWQQVQTQSQLLNCDVSALIDRLLEVELSTSLLQFLEKDRLKARLLEWLNLEKQRPPFTVMSREESAVISLAGLLFHLRLDRVDELETGGRVVIDYKTGEVSSKDWFAQRLEAPQLPLYAILGQYAGVLYASLKAGKMGFFGEENLTESQLQIWRDQLNQLAVEFKTGCAEVLPTQTACQYCHLSAVCRVHEQED